MPAPVIVLLITLYVLYTLNVVSKELNEDKNTKRDRNLKTILTLQDPWRPEDHIRTPRPLRLQTPLDLLCEGLL